MAKQAIGIGTSGNDGTGDTLRVALDKANDNFDELYGFQAVGATVAKTPARIELNAALGTVTANGAGWHKFITTTNGGSTYYWHVWTDGVDYLIHEYTIPS